MKLHTSATQHHKQHITCRNNNNCAKKTQLRCRRLFDTPFSRLNKPLTLFVFASDSDFSPIFRTPFSLLLLLLLPFHVCFNNNLWKLNCNCNWQNPQKLHKHALNVFLHAADRDCQYAAHISTTFFFSFVFAKSENSFVYSYEYV